MPPKQTITPEDIIRAGLTLAREKGFDALSARAVAKQLNCSTQPIYSCFSTMKTLQDAVLKEAFATATAEYLFSHEDEEISFKDIGMGYLRMAREDPHLYDMLYACGHAGATHWIVPVKTEYMVEIMGKEDPLSRLTPDERRKLLTHMAVFTHGLVMLGRVNPDLAPDYLEAQLHEMGRIVIGATLLEKGIPDHENPYLERQSQSG
ncbi:MAG TPA: hypothetical protein DHV36_16510 [Desulfobacteraceae bacterium]|nr:hypothetical protein [Desulfobacteraceae bacterium]